MKDWRAIVKKVLNLPIWMIIIFTVISAALLTVIFIKGWDTSPVAYAVYVLSFYSLTVFCFWCWKVIPGYYRSLKQRVYDNKFGNRYMTDVAFRTHVLLYASFAINLLYVATNVISGLIYKSAWFGILATYYSILAAMRFLLLRFVNKNGIGKERIQEFRRSRLCSIILLTLNFTLSGAVLMILYQNKGYEYNGVLIYIMAAYTFYVTTHAIIDLFKYRKYESPVMLTAKVINLAAALVSMLSLETAMLSQFGDENASPYFERIMIAATGGGVSIIVIAMSIYSIISATKAIRREKIHNGK